MELPEAGVEVRCKSKIDWHQVCPRRHLVLDASQIQLLGLPGNQAFTGAPLPFRKALEVSPTLQALLSLKSATPTLSQLD